MRIEHVKLSGFRNFASASIKLSQQTLVIGGNDVGKTNLLHAIRLLLDRTVSEAELEPRESDFHVSLKGDHATKIRIEIKLAEITEDAVISRLKGWRSDSGQTFLVYEAQRDALTHRIFIGHAVDALDELDSRPYLKYLHFKYVESCRNLDQYIQKEKRHLLKLAKQKRTTKEEAADANNELALQDNLNLINEGINQLHYVRGATSNINSELKRISQHSVDYEVGLRAQTPEFSRFVEKLSLGAHSSGKSIGLGGDGRNNQILVGLWKAKSEIEHDSQNEAIIYCIEEPEAHLHPHQQRKLAGYLASELNGQVFVSTHSPQIVSEFKPDGIVRLFERHGGTIAASGGCSECIDDAWEGMGYRMSILPAEAFFSDATFLVEGPSEVLFYRELAKQLCIDLDFHNVSVLAVDGVSFEVYVAILNAMEIPWIVRTDNDVSKVPKSNPAKWMFAGLNRARRLIGEGEHDHFDSIDDSVRAATWERDSKILNKKGVYVSRIDLENDLAAACPDALKAFADTDDIQVAVGYMQSRKAMRMREFTLQRGSELKALGQDVLVHPLQHVVRLSEARRKEAHAK